MPLEQHARRRGGAGQVGLGPRARVAVIHSLRSSMYVGGRYL